MSLKKVAITVPASSKEALEAYCSLCNKKAGPHTREWSADWRDGYEDSETGLYVKTGHNYPEGGSGEYRAAAVCVDCFEQRVIPALEAIGVKFDVLEYDY